MTAPTTSFTCPMPITSYATIQLGHGSGGRLMHDLLDSVFLPMLSQGSACEQHDCRVLTIGGVKLAFTTDSYVITPRTFPGGNIGDLAVNGTVNDLAMGGARPLYLSAGFILEEGLAVDELSTIVTAMQQAAAVAKVEFVTGDTKVVDRGKGDGVFINTAGIGIIEHDLTISPQRICQGDAILLSGDIGRHSIAVMAQREGLDFETTITSDCAPLVEMVMALLGAGIDIHCLRDCTRGGVATTLVEVAQASGLQLDIDEEAVPVCDAVLGACELLGLDPLYLANEGCCVAFVPAGEVERALAVMHGFTCGAAAVCIGTTTTEPRGTLSARNIIGTRRILAMLTGEQLPRIC